MLGHLFSGTSWVCWYNGAVAQIRDWLEIQAFLGLNNPDHEAKGNTTKGEPTHQGHFSNDWLTLTTSVITNQSNTSMLDVF